MSDVMLATPSRLREDHGDMAVGRAVLIIADIGGYTPFMRLHRTSLAHAQDVVARLLEAMIDAAAALTLLEIEGDGAFFYAWAPDGREGSTGQRHIDALNTCWCEGCRQTGRLRVKFVAHLGDVAVQQVKRSSKLTGLDVILVHRLLKNAVPIPEYLLVSEAVFERVDDRARRRGRALEQELEGLGVAPTYFLDLADVAGGAAPAPEVTALGRLRENVGVVIRSLPYLLRLKPRRFAARGAAV